MTFKKGDKLKRISDGKSFTFAGKADSDNENYIHVEEMCVPVYLPDFLKEDEDVKFVSELKDGEKLQSMIKQFEEAVKKTGEVSLTSDQAAVLLSEIKFLQADNKALEELLRRKRIK
jgi:hypothetical protein